MADTPKPTGKQSNLVLVAALAANLGIAVAKFIAAGISGSSSMLTEGVHSVVDSGNQMLLLYGKHRAKKPADHDHPRSEEHTSELQTPMRISYAVFCLKIKKYQVWL